MLRSYDSPQYLTIWVFFELCRASVTLTQILISGAFEGWLRYSGYTHSSLTKLRLQISRTFLPLRGPLRAPDSPSPSTDGKVSTSSCIRSQLVAELGASCFCPGLLPLAQCSPWSSPLPPNLLFQNKTNTLQYTYFYSTQMSNLFHWWIIKRIGCPFQPHQKLCTGFWFNSTLENCETFFLPYTQWTIDNLSFSQLCYFSSLLVWLSTE